MIATFTTKERSVTFEDIKQHERRKDIDPEGTMPEGIDTTFSLVQNKKLDSMSVITNYKDEKTAIFMPKTVTIKLLTDNGYQIEEL